MAVYSDYNLVIIGSMRKLTKNEIANKYSEGYLKLLEENRWIQSFLKTKKSWHDYYEDLWIPDLPHLWRLVEAMIPLDPEKEEDVAESISSKVMLKKRGNIYVVEYKKENCKTKRFVGNCPEEALLKLFVFLEKN